MCGLYCVVFLYAIDRVCFIALERILPMLAVPGPAALGVLYLDHSQTQPKRLALLHLPCAGGLCNGAAMPPIRVQLEWTRPPQQWIVHCHQATS